MKVGWLQFEASKKEHDFYYKGQKQKPDVFFEWLIKTKSVPVLIPPLPPKLYFWSTDTKFHSLPQNISSHYSHLITYAFTAFAHTQKLKKFFEMVSVFHVPSQMPTKTIFGPLLSSYSHLVTSISLDLKA